MKLQKECIECILNQAKRVASIIGADNQLSHAIESKALEMSKDFSFHLTPPEVATPMYEALALLAKTEDLYKDAKLEATQKALLLIPQLESDLKTCSNPLLRAGKLAVAGNVIDLASHTTFDVESEVETVLKTPFAIDHWNELLGALAKSKSLLYLADNAGEHIFDALFIKTIKEHYPKLHITFMTRANAIINDVTLEEAGGAGIGLYADLESSGVTTPGFIFDNANDLAQSAFKHSDMVIAKGMGNYETLTEINIRSVFHLFKVKCHVVSQDTGKALGSLICMKRD